MKTALKTDERLRLAAALATLLTAACWIGGAWWIWITGSHAADPAVGIYTAERIHRVLWITVPVSCLWLAVLTAAAVAQRKGTPETRAAVAGKDRSFGSCKPVRRMSDKTRLLRGVLLLGALLLIALGVGNGGARDVLYKAIKICTECIGLG